MAQNPVPTGVANKEWARLVACIVAAMSAIAGVLAFAGVIVPEDATVAVGVALESVGAVVVAAGEFIRSKVWSAATVYKIDPAALNR